VVTPIYTGGRSWTRSSTGWSSPVTANDAHDHLHENPISFFALGLSKWFGRFAVALKTCCEAEMEATDIGSGIEMHLQKGTQCTMINGELSPQMTTT